MLKMFTVFDSKVGAYTNPILARSAGEAMRSFGAACCDVKHDFHRYAEDYTLFEIGEWDELTATIVTHITPLAICKAIELSNIHSAHYFASRNVEKVA